MSVEVARGCGRRLTFEEAVEGLSALQKLRAQNVELVRARLASLSAEQRQLLRTFLSMKARATGANYREILAELREADRAQFPPPPVSPTPPSGLDPSDIIEREWVKAFGH